MDYSKIYFDLKKHFPDLEIYQNHPLAPYTTLKIGGPADIFINSKTQEHFISILKLVYHNLDQFGAVNSFSAHSERESAEADEPEGSEHCKNSLTSHITILGNGSNVLISDTGIRGLVVKNSSQDIKILKSCAPATFSPTYTQRMENEPEKYLDFSKVNYDESHLPSRLVRLSSGTPLPLAINNLIEHGLTGLQWFAYIPGTIGGAVWYNIHGGSYHFADYIHSVNTFNLKTGKIKTFKKSNLKWQYEKSFFQQNPHLIILSATLRLFKGDTNLAKKVVQAWISQKVKVQPMNSAGSAFANPPLAICQKIWGEQKSAGWIIDHELGLKGHAIGGAQTSPLHANFIVNTGHATAKDYLSLVRLIQSTCKQKFHFKLETEVKLLGI
ncbi:MAG: FAD-binding protein [Candidatus Shapirobacteria bacterium]|jgi:UDP-N-acetylmuramate dehydrogenase